MSYSLHTAVLPKTDPRLGRHVEHDSRSRSFAFRAPAAAPLQSLRYRRNIAVLDQGDLGSCTGNAATGALATGRNYVGKVTAQPLDEHFAVSLYATATTLDSVKGTYPPTDTGSTGLAVAKACLQAGFISGYQHTFTLPDALAALQVGPVIAGTNWFASMFDPAPDGRLTVSGSLQGGHEYVVDEIDVERQRVWLTNSWSASWGVDGRAYFTWADFGRLLDQDGDVVLFTPITQPAPVPTPAPTPTPAPAPGDADDAVLWGALAGWASARHTGSNRAAAKAVNTWAAAKGYRA